MRNQFVQSILDEIDIIQLISEDVTIEGNKANCPFPDHEDANPSFIVYPPDSFYCFGCKRGGTAIDYIMHRNNMTAGEAIRYLCEKYNIPMPSWSDEEKKVWERERREKEIVLKILSEAAEYYHEKLTPERREYFHNRGLIDETIDKLKLGYADGTLYAAFKEEIAGKHNDVDLLLSGLFVRFEDGTIKDSFERRYMFPYWKSGKVVYFIGRLDTDDPTEIEQLPKWNRAKYKKLSTFDKKERPYISQAVRNDYFYGEDSVGENETGITTEGVVDCIHLLQAGYSCISPVTEEFKDDDLPKLAKLSKRWKTTYIANDNEESGIGKQGAVKTTKYLFEQGLDVRIATVPRPEGVKKVDVADFFNVPIEQYDQRKQEFQAILDEAPDFIEWKINEVAELTEKERPKALKEIISLIPKLDVIERDYYKDLLAKRFNLRARTFDQVLKNSRAEAQKSKTETIRDEIEEVRTDQSFREYQRKREIAELVVGDMRERGIFYRTATEQYYFFDNDKTLMSIGDSTLEVRINEWYGLNRTEKEYEYTLAEFDREAALRGKETDVYQFAYYDKNAHVLYVYNNANQIYRLNGSSIDLVDNGTDGILFLGDPLWEPFAYKDIGNGDFLLPLVVNRINFVDGAHVNLNRDEQRIMFVLWLYSLFFESIQPTKPIQAFIGEKGSGKSTTQRIIGKLLFGSRFNLTPITKEDDFDAAVTHNYLVAFDNVDGKIKWLNDRLSHTATGKMIQKRELYTTNKVARYFPRCFLSLNAREPKFKRDDVVDRLLLCQVERLPKFRSEAKIIGEILEHRDELWSELLKDLNMIVAALKKDNEQFLTSHRMADWAELAWRIAKIQEQGDRFIELLEKMDRAQSEFLLEDEPIYQCLEVWLPNNIGITVTTAELYQEFKKVAEENNILFYYESTRSLGMRLRNILTNLAEFYDIESTKERNKWRYSFRPKC